MRSGSATRDGGSGSEDCRVAKADLQCASEEPEAYPDDSRPAAAARLGAGISGLRLRQRDHAAPELLALSGVDVVFPCQGKLPIVADAIDDHAGCLRLDGAPFAQRAR